MAGADNQIIVEIVLDDGSIQKGFIKLEKAAEDTAKKSGGFFDNAFKINGVTDLAASFLIVEKAAQKVGAVLKEVFNLALLGENLKAGEKQFESLAQTAGVSSDQIRAGLEAVSGGLVGTDDLMKIASNAIVQLGKNAAQLPAVFNVARQAAVQFGGDATEKLELLNQAIASGRTATLKSIGLTVDNDKAVLAYARSLGKATSELTDSQLQQARLNAILAEAGNRYKAIDVDSRVLANTSTRLGVAFHDVREVIGQLTNTALGGFFATAGTAATHALEKITAFLKQGTGAPLEASAANLKDLQDKLDRLNNSRAAINSDGFDSFARIVESTTKKVEAMRAEIERQASQPLVIAPGQSLETIRAQIDAAAQIKEQEKEKDIQREMEKQLRIQALDNSFQSQTISALQALEQVTFDLQEKQLLQNEIQKEKELQLELAHEQAIANIRTQFSDEKGFNDITRRELELSAIQAHNDQKIALERQGNRIQIEEDARKASILKGANDALRNGITQAISGSIQAMVTALAKGENAISAFGTFLAKFIGGLMVQIGEAFVALGVAKLAALGTPFATIAAGAALIAIGSLISALAGGGGESSPGGGVSSASSAGPATTESAASGFTSQEQIKETGPSIVVNVQGNILDRKQTGLELVEIISESFGTSATVLTG